jgi:DNA-binding GntR family transcriptional regulator
LIDQTRNYRLFVDYRPYPYDACMAGTPGGNLTTRAYESLRRDILTGRLAPGSPLRIGALASERDVSMSVVREALTRLSEQGLVASSPNQGFRVIPLSRDDLLDLTELRVAFETMALRRSVDRGTLDWEGAVIAAHHVLASTEMFEAGPPIVREDWAAAHTRFHTALIAACGSPRLLGTIRTLSDSAEIYRQWAVSPGLQEGRDIAGEHRQLMELTTSRRADEAAAALAAHLNRTAEVLLTSAERRANQIIDNS